MPLGITKNATRKYIPWIEKETIHTYSFMYTAEYKSAIQLTTITLRVIVVYMAE